MASKAVDRERGFGRVECEFWLSESEKIGCGGRVLESTF